MNQLGFNVNEFVTLVITKFTQVIAVGVFVLFIVDSVVIMVGNLVKPGTFIKS